MTMMMTKTSLAHFDVVAVVVVVGVEYYLPFVRAGFEAAAVELSPSLVHSFLLYLDLMSAMVI